MPNSTSAHEQDTSEEPVLPAANSITAGNIKPSSSLNITGSVQPKVLKLFTDVKGVIRHSAQYRYRKDCDAPVPSLILAMWRERGYAPSSAGIAIVNFLQDRKESKAYRFPLYFWEAV